MRAIQKQVLSSLTLPQKLLNKTLNSSLAISFRKLCMNQLLVNKDLPQNL